MEKLKSIIPTNLKHMIEQSNPDDLPSTSSSLHDFFSQSPLFHSMVDNLSNPQLGLCGKNKEDALELKNKGNAAFSSGNYSQALCFYSKALRVVPVDAVDKDNKLVSTLYVNRASSLHRLFLLEESLRDCNRALKISPRYAKAWYRRGKANTSMMNYKDAICDLKVAINMEGTGSGKRQIESDLKLIVHQNKTGNSVGKISGRNLRITDEAPQAKVQCVSTPAKGRGMVSMYDIPPASLVHNEEPYAAIILKKFRETHCHFCFNELPADTVPCASCSIPVYCSEHCQLQAGRTPTKYSINDEDADMLSGELKRYFSEVTLESYPDSGVKCSTEHGHECRGVNWPAVLPADVVLAGRILVKLEELNEHSCDGENITKNLELSHNYAQLPAESKLELHVYSIVLLYCIHYSSTSKLELNGAIIAKVIVLNSQIKINAMAIVRMKYFDSHHPLNQSETSLPGDNLTSNLEQVRVGQAIYLTGSLFNHSCLPNIHAYFVSRTLLMRATEFVATGCPLELSYGPQVGQWEYRHRQEFLLDNYSFICQCIGCMRLNRPDLVRSAFRCVKTDCLGVVLDCCTAEYERHKILHLQDIPEVHSLELQREVDELNYHEIQELANHEIQSGCCLKCGTANDLNKLQATVGEAEGHTRSLQEALGSNKVHADLISKALSSLKILKSALHPYNKKLAEAEDILARAFCLVGEMQQAMDHCTAAIEILKKIYNPGHIAVGNELVKLSSIQLALADPASADTVNRICSIFSNYYGSHAEVMFPYLRHLKSEVHKIADGTKYATVQV